MQDQAVASPTLVPVPRDRRAWWAPFLWSVSRQRLLDSAQVYRAELAAVGAVASVRPRTPPRAVLDLLDRAEAAAHAGETELGWKCLQSAQRLELFAMDDGERSASAEVLLAEAKKKLDSSWRLEAVLRLLALPEGEGVTRDPARIHAAMLQLHEHYGNVYTRHWVVRRQLGWLALMTAGTFAAWAAVVAGWAPALHALSASGPWSPAGVARPAGNALAFDLTLLPSVLACGGLGAAFSAFLSLARPGSRGSVPEALQGNVVTVARLAAGFLAALAVYLLLASGVLNLGSILQPPLVLVAAFAAGFSERIVVRSLEALGGK